MDTRPQRRSRRSRPFYGRLQIGLGIMMIFGLGAAGCARSGDGAAKAASAAETGSPTLPVRVEALASTRYYARCHIRTFRDYDGRSASGYANVFVIDAAGPFKGDIPSSNAQCVFAKLAGPGKVVLHISKAGDHWVAASAPSAWVRLNVW